MTLSTVLFDALADEVAVPPDPPAPARLFPAPLPPLPPAPPVEVATAVAGPAMTLVPVAVAEAVPPEPPAPPEPEEPFPPVPPAPPVAVAVFEASELEAVAVALPPVPPDSPKGARNARGSGGAGFGIGCRTKWLSAKSAGECQCQKELSSGSFEIEPLSWGLQACAGRTRIKLGIIPGFLVSDLTVPERLRLRASHFPILMPVQPKRNLFVEELFQRRSSALVCKAGTSAEDRLQEGATHGDISR